jgi:hypothetical protein
VTYGKELLPDDVRNRIDRAIDDSAPAWQQFVDDNRAPRSPQDEPGPALVLKYTSAEYAKNYRTCPNDGIFIGCKNFTWGKAVYVTGVEEPLSTAIYGRAGLVAQLDLTPGWRVFDARDKAKYGLYLEWLRLQPAYDDAVLTVHTDHWLHGLRNDFREQFAIDVVLCRPDEFDSRGWYTDPTDTWACVSDWNIGPAVAPAQRQLASYAYSWRFDEVRLTVVPEEEFLGPKDPTTVRPPSQPPRRVAQLEVSGSRPVAPDLRRAYWLHQVVRVPS